MKQLQRIAVFLILTVTLVSCGAIVKGTALKKTTFENKAIPPDFAEDPGTLICILRGRNSRDRYLKKHFEKQYGGDFVFILRDSLDSPRYADTDKYRYLFDYNTLSSDRMVTNPQSGQVRMTQLTSSRYYIQDRKTQVYYTNGVSSGYFSKLIQVYAISLEKARTGELKE